MESAQYVKLPVIFNQQMYLVAVSGPCFEIISETPVELLFFSTAYNYLKEMHMRSCFFLQIFSWPLPFSNEPVVFKVDSNLLKGKEHSLNCIISQIKRNYQLQSMEFRRYVHLSLGVYDTDTGIIS